MLETYLNGKTALQAGKIRAALEKQFNFSTMGIKTLAEAIEILTKKPECELSCYCGTSKKRDGLRFATKPEWSIFTMDPDGYMSGPRIPKVAAEYANWLMGGKFDIEAMQAKADEEYAKESKAAYEAKQRKSGISSLRMR